MQAKKLHSGSLPPMPSHMDMAGVRHLTTNNIPGAQLHHVPWVHLKGLEDPFILSRMVFIDKRTQERYSVERHKEGGYLTGYWHNQATFATNMGWVQLGLFDAYCELTSEEYVQNLLKLMDPEKISEDARVISKPATGLRAWILRWLFA